MKTRNVKIVTFSATLDGNMSQTFNNSSNSNQKLEYLGNIKYIIFSTKKLQHTSDSPLIVVNFECCEKYELSFRQNDRYFCRLSANGEFIGKINEWIC